jgi:hypothetical protein
MMSGKEWLIYTMRLALRCAVAIVVVTVLFFLVAGFLAFPVVTCVAVGAFFVGMLIGAFARGPREWLHHRHHLPV